MATKKKATRKARPKKTTKAQKPAWIYLLAGLLIGLFIAGVVYVSKQPASKVDLKEEARKTTRDAVDKTNEVIDKKLDELNDSEFFEKLPSLDNMPLDGLPTLPDLTPDFQSNSGSNNLPPQPLTQMGDDTGSEANSNAPETMNIPKPFIIQVGSFANFEHADEQKAQLILNNWGAFIKTATLDDGRQRYRVYVGTFNKADIPSAKARLAKLGIKKPLVLNAQ